MQKSAATLILKTWLKKERPNWSYSDVSYISMKGSEEDKYWLANLSYWYETKLHTIAVKIYNNPAQVVILDPEK